MASRLFYSPFPTPAFLSMPSVGLDISDKSIRFLGFRREKGHLLLDRYAEEPLAPGIVEQGRINDARRMKEVLTAFKNAHKLEFVRASLPEEQAYLFPMNVPLVKKRDLKESILLQFEEYVPLKAVESVFDYELVSESADGFNVQVSAIPTPLAESYADIFIESGLTPMSFEIEAQAIARAVVPAKDKGTYMVVDFGKSRTGVSVVSAGIVVFTSTIELGGAMLNDAIVKALGVSMAEAEHLKREQGLTREGNKKEEKNVFSAVSATIATFRDDISKHYIYWHTHREGELREHRPIEKIILCGGDSNLRGLPEYLASSMRVKVELANVWVNVKTAPLYVPEITFSNSLTYATAIGLALGDFEI